MSDKLLKLQNEIKSNIQRLISENKLDKAKILIDDYYKINKNDIEIFSMKSILYILKNEMKEAENTLKQGLRIDENNFDLNYNLAYLYEIEKKDKLSNIYYKRAYDNCENFELKSDIKKHVKIVEDRKKIAFFVKLGMDSFLNDIINNLSSEYEIKKVIVTEYNQIDEGMEWADICWFEWCDDLVIYGSESKLAKEKKVICRLHSYEAFAGYVSNVCWNNVEKVIFVGKNIRKFVIDTYKLDKEKTVLIPNGVDVRKYTFKERTNGFNVAYVGYINYKKGPMLLLHVFKALYDFDNRYKLYIAGQFQDNRDLLYFKQMIKEFDMESNVIYEGWQTDLDSWLEDKNYILCTSILESQNMSVMQAMAKGIKPIVHNFVGAREIYSDKYIWNTIDDAINIINEGTYNSKEYFEFVNNNYTLKKELKDIKRVLIDKFYIDTLSSHKPLVTIGIINYNGEKYIKNCLESYINQDYSNVEILVIDDCSSDGSKKIIQDYEANYENIRAIYHEKNSGGASKGIQEIIKYSKGKYFQWIACDDFVEKDSVKLFVEYLENRPTIDYVYSDFNIVNESNVTTGKWSYSVPHKDEVVRSIFNSGSGIIPMNGMYRVNFFEKNDISWLIYRENDFSCDTLNTLHFIKYNIKYGKVDKGLINYRIHGNNLSNSIEKRIKSLVSIFDYVIKNFDIKIYLPQFEWSKIKNKDQFKNYILSLFYYEQIRNNIDMKNIPDYLKGNITNRDIKGYCSMLIEEGISYLEQASNMGEMYKSEINDLKVKYYENYR